MRIVLVVRSFPKVSTTFILNKVIGLRAQGVDVHVVCWTSHAAAWARMPGDVAADSDLRRRIHLVPSLDRPMAALDLVRLAAQRGAGRPRRHERGVATLLRVLEPDLVHFEFGSVAATCLTSSDLARGLLDGVPIVASFRGHDLNCVGLDRPGFYDRVWERADAVHCLGNDLWLRAQRRGCPSTKRHVLIPPAVDCAQFRPLSRPPELIGTRGRPMRLLSVGRLHWKKGYRHGLAATRLLQDHGVVVDHCIIGDGPDRDEVRACARALGLDGSVRFMGAQPRAQVIEALQWADVFVHSSVSEGFCNAVMEAQAMELPVVCTDADGLGENVADGETGFVVARRDEAAMADALIKLAGDLGLRLTMGATGRRRVAAQFRPEDQIEAFTDLYDSVITGSSADALTSR